MATWFCRVRSMLRCLCTPSVVDQTLTELADTQHQPEMTSSVSKQEESWQQHKPPWQEAAMPDNSTGSAIDISHNLGAVAGPPYTVSNCSASSAACVVEPSSDSTTSSSSSSSSHTGANSDKLASSSSHPSVCSSAGQSQVAAVASSKRWKQSDFTAMEACRRTCGYGSGIAVVASSPCEPEQQQPLQQPTSLHAASGGDYARLLQLQQLQTLSWHGGSIHRGGLATGRRSPLTHSASSPCLAYSSSPVRCSTADTSSQHSEAVASAECGAAVQLQQQHHRAAIPLTRTCSWPWLFGSSSSSSNKTPHRTTAAAGKNRRLLSEAGAAAVAGAAGLHPAVQAHLQGTLGIAFSGGGFRFTYFVGVMDVLLHHLGLVGPTTLLSGASSGALIAVFTKCGLPVERVLQLTDKLSRECNAQGLKGNLGTLLRAHLEANLPDDAHITCHNNTFMAVTQVWPAIRTRLFSSFPTRMDLINAMMASCHLPTLSDGSFTVNFNGRLHIDGGLLSVLTPPPGAAHSVHVCSMPSRQIAKLPAFISRPQQSDISISPDTYQTWPFTRSQTTGMALQPPNPEFIEHMVARGRADAMAWAETVGLTRDGLPVFPPAARLDQLRQEVFGSGLQTVAATAVSAAAVNAAQRTLLRAGLSGSSSCNAAAQPAWELFYSRALQEGMLQQKQLQKQGLRCHPSQALAAEAATAQAAKAASEDAAVVAAEVAKALSPTARQGLQSIKSGSVFSVPIEVAGSSSSSSSRTHVDAVRVANQTLLPQQYPAVEMAGRDVLEPVAAPVGPGSVSGSSDSQAGSSGDWQFLVAELGINTNAEVQELAAAAAGGSY